MFVVVAMSETMQQLIPRVNSISCIKIGSKDGPVSKLSGYRLELSKFDTLQRKNFSLSYSM